MAKSITKLKILLLNPTLGLGGTEKIIINFFKFLKNYKRKIVILNYRNSFFSELINKNQIINLNSKRARYSFIQLLKVVKKEKPDYVFSNQREMNIILCILKMLLRVDVTSVIREAAPISEHSKINNYYKLYLYFLRFIYRHCDGIIFNSEFTKNSFLKKGFSFKKQVVINNPLLTKINRKKKNK